MKYWNKDKIIRQKHWTKVSRTQGISTNRDLKLWCQRQPSKGKFYFYYGSTSWWFEHSEDAMFFMLRWS